MMDFIGSKLFFKNKNYTQNEVKGGKNAAIAGLQGRRFGLGQGYGSPDH
jgi:hypothetical protein